MRTSFVLLLLPVSLGAVAGCSVDSSAEPQGRRTSHEDQADPALPPSDFGSFTTVGATGDVIWFADLDGDRLADLVQHSPGGELLGQLNLGGLRFADPVTIGNTTNDQVQFADVDGDGRADLVQQATGCVYVQIQGGLAFGSPRLIAQTPDPVILADLDGDGRADMIHLRAETMAVQWNVGGSFPKDPQPLLGVDGSVAFADLNGDHLADLVQVTQKNSEVTGRLNLGSATFGNLTHLDFALGSSPPSFADVDGDGRADMILHDDADRRIQVALHVNVK